MCLQITKLFISEPLQTRRQGKFVVISAKIAQIICRPTTTTSVLTTTTTGGFIPTTTATTTNSNNNRHIYIYIIGSSTNFGVDAGFNPMTIYARAQHADP